MASFLSSIFKFNNSSSSSNSNNNDFIESNDKLRLRSLKKEEVLIKDIEKTFKTEKFQKYLIQNLYNIHQKGSFSFKSYYVIKMLKKQ